MFDIDRLGPVERLAESCLDFAASERLEGLDDDTLAERVVAMRASIDRLEAELARRLTEMEHRRSYSRDGYPSLTAFLMHRTRMSARTAQRNVSRARAMATMQLGSKLWTTGEISGDQATILASTRNGEPDHFPDVEDTLVDIARDTPWVEALAVAARRWRHTVQEQRLGSAELERQQREQRRLHASRTFHGMVRVDGWLDPDAGTTFLTALDAATPPPSDGDHRTPAHRRADALIDLATNRLGRAKPHLEIRVDYDTITAGTGTAETVDGQSLTSTALHRHACDTSITRIVFGPDSQPLDVGRTRRVVPGPL
ncbi:MAG: DUF222 domain-containing protein, partial [Acidimicrobiia bacterium]|nr:DUF222 domain-containing protein [Acidimicrobiia bacterium]